MPTIRQLNRNMAALLGRGYDSSVPYDYEGYNVRGSWMVSIGNRPRISSGTEYEIIGYRVWDSKRKDYRILTPEQYKRFKHRHRKPNKKNK